MISKATAVLRAGCQLLWMMGELCRAAITISISPTRRRAEALHKICRRLVPVFGVRVQATGSLPRRGLLVANHLSYLDIIVLASMRPCVFVAKSEVASWPVFGWFARKAGTIFVQRQSRRDTVRVGEEIRAALRGGALVILFPEGTSSNGSSVLPFKSSLLEPVAGERVPVHAGALDYRVSDGSAADDICYWGDHTLVPHLLRLLTKRDIEVRLACTRVQNTWRDRKKLAAQLHDVVSGLHNELRLTESEAQLTLISTRSGRPFERSFLKSPAPNSAL